MTRKYRILPFVILMISAAANAQFYKLHGASVSVGATGQFTTPLTTNPETGTYNVPFGTAGVSTYPESISGQAQTTTSSVGVLTSLQFHPVPFAGMELNYSYTNYSEKYFFNYSTTGAQQIQVPTDAHEATAAYSFHPRHIPFQPFVNVGGGAIDFLPRGEAYANQWRAAGLLEAGFDIPLPRTKRLALRLEGRSLYYRAPNFNQAAVSTHSWRVTEEPSVSWVYRF